MALLAFGRGVTRDGERLDSVGGLSRLLVGVAAAMGRLDQRFDALLDPASLCRTGNVRGANLLFLQPVHDLAVVARRGPQCRDRVPRDLSTSANRDNTKPCLKVNRASC